tara:strand:+ start:19056 stop:19160 length:105 start_codon:yes stop_codon:yes gene_type:complete
MLCNGEYFTEAGEESAGDADEVDSSDTEFSWRVG